MKVTSICAILDKFDLIGNQDSSIKKEGDETKEPYSGPMFQELLDEETAKLEGEGNNGK